MRMCEVLTCMGLPVIVGLLIWILIKQHQCCKQTKSGYSVLTDSGPYHAEGYREYSGGLSGTTAGFYGGQM